MTTKYETISGIAKWAKVYEPDTFSGSSNWKINLYFKDKAERSKFEATGVQLTIKSDTDGDYVTFRRPVKKVFGDEVTFFAPPEIVGEVNVKYVDKDGAKVRQFKKGEDPVRVGEPVKIGNGSVILVNFCYYDTAKGKGHRLEGINVKELVAYEPSVDAPKEDVTTEESVKVDKPKKAELNDQIPW